MERAWWRLPTIANLEAGTSMSRIRSFVPAVRAFGAGRGDADLRGAYIEGFVTSSDLGARGRLLLASLAGLPRPSYDRTLGALRSWLDSWAGIGSRRSRSRGFIRRRRSRRKLVARTTSLSNPGRIDRATEEDGRDLVAKTKPLARER